MLSDVKTVVEIIQKLLGLREVQREKIADFMDRIADELSYLSAEWTQACMHLENGRDVTHHVLRQRSHYAVLLQVLQSRRTNREAFAESSQEFFDTIEAAIDTKGRLYQLAHEILWPGEPMMEKLVAELRGSPEERNEKRMEEARAVDLDDESLSEADRMYYRYLKRQLPDWDEAAPAREKERAKEEDRRARIRREALSKLRTHTSELAALSGSLRAQAALYRSAL